MGWITVWVNEMTAWGHIALMSDVIQSSIIDIYFGVFSKWLIQSPENYLNENDFFQFKKKKKRELILTYIKSYHFKI